MAKCDSCGAELPKNESVCAHCGSDNAKTVRELIVNDGSLVISEGATLTLASAEKGTAKEKKLLAAAAEGDIETVTRLLSEGVGVDTRNSIGQTPLVIASARGYNELAGFLISRGADVNASDKYGATPLLGAALNGSSKTIRVLLKHGADCEAANEDGTTPLIGACGTRSSKSDVNALTSKTKKTPDQLATSPEVKAYLESRKKG